MCKVNYIFVSIKCFSNLYKQIAKTEKKPLEVATFKELNTNGFTAFIGLKPLI